MATEEATGSDELRAAVTDAANRAAHGQRDGLDHLFAQRYEELLAIARALAARDGPGKSLTPTSLVHEAFVRLVDKQRITDRGSVFFRACFAQVARHILVDHARKRRSLRRGGDQQRQELQKDGGEAAAGFDLVQLDDAIARLAALPQNGARMARVVELRVFVGLTVAECAEALGVSPRTVDADWHLARAFLRSRLEGAP